MKVSTSVFFLLGTVSCLSLFASLSIRQINIAIASTQLLSLTQFTSLCFSFSTYKISTGQFIPQGIVVRFN